MTDATDSRALEHEVEEARSRFASTVDRLTSPETTEATKEEIKAYAQSAKDEIAGFVSAKVEEATSYLTKAKDSARDTAQQKVHSFTEDLQERARANPLAVGLIGAGIAWRLYKHPPVTTLLVGAGVALLMNGPSRTRKSVRVDPYDPDRPTSYVPGGVAGEGYSSGGGIAQRVGDAMLRASGLGHQAGDRPRELASDAADRVSEVASDVRSRAREAGSDFAERATDASHRASEAVGRASEAAGDLSARATRLAREAAESAGNVASDLASNADRLVQRGRGNPYVLGGVGLASGIAIWRAVQATESGSRFIDRTGQSLRHAARRASEAAGSATERTGARASYVASATRASVTRTVTETLGAVRGAPSKARGAHTEPRSTHPAATGSSSRPSGRGGQTSAGWDAAISRWLDEEVLAMPQRYPLLVAALGFTVGAAAGGSIRLTAAERETIGPVSRDVGQRALDAAHEQYEHVVDAARDAAEELKSRLSQEPERKDQSGGIETVLGGEPLPAAQTASSPQNAMGSATSGPAPRPMPGGTSVG
jgi:hypothetical protein